MRARRSLDLRDELVGFGGDQGEGLEAGTVGPLPRIPDAGEGKGAWFGEGDGKDAFDPLGWGDHIRRSLPALSGLLRRLRQKMVKNGFPDPVENVRGRGSRLLESIRLNAKAPIR
jgi:hypothetical protein